MDDIAFIDFYDFLGIPPGSPPNLIYLAINKLKSFDWSGLAGNGQQKLAQIEDLFDQAHENLLNTTANRRNYEKQWEAYYFPNDGRQTDVGQSCHRSAGCNFLSSGRRCKSLPLERSTDESQDNFAYDQDFTYFMMRDLAKDRDVFFLNTHESTRLSPLPDSVYFQQRRFYLQTQGKIKSTISNDAMGKNIIVTQAEGKIPLHIGDRIEFADGTRLILRSIYSAAPVAGTEPDNQLGFFFARENVFIELQPSQIYIVGRNTSDIRHLDFDENIFCFINIGRRERSISRQNFQVFFHGNRWFIQDLGSRYGTTLDYRSHPKLETLAGGSIMALESGRIRLGYDKSYIINVDSIQQLKSISMAKRPEMLTTPELSIYNVPLL